MNSLVNLDIYIYNYYPSLLVLYLNVSRVAKYLRLSPITMQFATDFISFLISFSIRTGAIFSPPPVMMSSLILPVMIKLPFLYNLPTSHE